MHIIAKTAINSMSLNQKAISPFLGISYQDPNAIALSYKQVASYSYPRQELVNILSQYNTLIGNDALASQNIERLGSNKLACIVTGQQLGLMGGPAYTILKGISCLLMARANGAIPVFWLATEDNDVAEIDHTYLLDAYGNLKYFHLSLPKDGRCVEDLKLTKNNNEVLYQFLQSISMDKSLWPELNESYSQTMAQVMVRLFANTGMVFVEPKLLRPLARSFLLREIEDRDNLLRILQSTTARLVAAGGKETISFNNDSTNLFLKDIHGHRCKIHFDNGIFKSGNQKYTKQDLLSLIEKEPYRFSTNVAARPVLQSLIIPTLAYVAGPSELEYHCQLGDYFRAHNTFMPCIVPRLTVTFIPAYAAEILEKCKIDPTKEIPLHWMDMSPSLGEGFAQLAVDWKQSAFKQFENEISLEAIERTIKYSILKLQKKVVRTRLQSQKIPLHGLHLLRNLIHPHHKLQERVLNWWSFQAYSQENLIKELLKLLPSIPQSHVYCYC